MLSNSAFNALLKTLEEPPAHVKFIFATTEIKKVPVTILSRCQRFDLRRLDESEIAAHLQNILAKENFSADEAGLEMIAKSSEGSVRDSLSLLDQALANNSHEKHLGVEVVEKMLGFIDKTKVLQLLECLFSGDFVASEKIFSEIFATSSDVNFLLQILIEMTHDITAVKLLKGRKISGYSAFQQQKISEIAAKIPLSALTRIWQMLNKGAFEVNVSFSPKMAFEMLMVRICHIASLPNLKEVLLAVSNQQSPEKPVAASDQDDLVNEILRNFEGAKIANN